MHSRVAPWISTCLRGCNTSDAAGVHSQEHLAKIKGAKSKEKERRHSRNASADWARSDKVKQHLAEMQKAMAAQQAPAPGRFGPPYDKVA